MILHRRSLRLVALTSSLFIGSALAGCSSEDDGSAANRPTVTSAQSTLEPTATTVRQATVEPTATIEMLCLEIEWSEPVDTKEGLARAVDEIFLARVLSMGETISGDGIPYERTPFVVSVEQSLLGDLDGDIKVIQQAGYDRAHHSIVSFECDPLLEVGQTYVLATLSGRNPGPDDDDRHVIVPLFGTILVQNEDHRQQLIQEFTDAIDLAGVGT